MKASGHFVCFMNLPMRSSNARAISFLPVLYRLLHWPTGLMPTVTMCAHKCSWDWLAIVNAVEMHDVMKVGMFESHRNKSGGGAAINYL